MKANRIAEECPISHRDLPETSDLREHLLAEHTKEELARWIESEIDDAEED